MLARRDTLEDRFQTPALTTFRRIFGTVPINVVAHMAAHHTTDRGSKKRPIVGVFVMYVAAGPVPSPRPRDPLVTVRKCVALSPNLYIPPAVRVSTIS